MTYRHFLSSTILWMEEILHQLIGGKHPIAYRFSAMHGGADIDQ